MKGIFAFIFAVSLFAVFSIGFALTVLVIAIGIDALRKRRDVRHFMRRCIERYWRTDAVIAPERGMRILAIPDAARL